SGWVQSPGAEALEDPQQQPRFKAYVTGVVGAFAKDQRILGWDVWNEPDNTNGAAQNDPNDKRAIVEKLLPQVFEWARSADPSQPLTSGVWDGVAEEWGGSLEVDANAAHATGTVGRDYISQLQLAGELRGACSGAEEAATPRDLHGIYGAVGGKHIRHHSAACERA
ncbi:MAG TPA: endo-1,4-beta-xylanase, partial [Terriglobales bacterium]|nr:endo-1,4-beta-xylanase [Terriglobales bacterium]